MAIRNILRSTTPVGYATPTSAPIYVDADDNIVKMIPAGSGTTEVQLVDTSSVQTLANKSVTPALTTIAGDGAITIQSGTVLLTKATPAAITIAAPTAGQAGTRITITSGTDQAHVVTFTGSTLLDGTTGANITATFPAFAGASITVIAALLKWNVESLQIVVAA